MAGYWNFSRQFQYVSVIRTSGQTGPENYGEFFRIVDSSSAVHKWKQHLLRTTKHKDMAVGTQSHPRSYSPMRASKVNRPKTSNHGKDYSKNYSKDYSNSLDLLLGFQLAMGVPQ